MRGVLHRWDRHWNGWRGCGLLAAVLVFGAFVPASYRYINHDVSFLVWAADQVLGPAVYGVDLLDVSPPLCIMPYVPAALLANLVGFEWGIRIWMLLISVVSLVTFFHTADRFLRLPVAIVLVLFVTFAYPDHYGQKDQIALLLCVPYVAGASSSRGWGVLSGGMAGVGFLMKPHFLIPLVLILALRRKIGVEERAILAVGVAYGVVIAIFFRPYVFEMLPAVHATYWAIGFTWIQTVSQAAIILVAAVPLAAATPGYAAARPYLVAALGFTAAAVLQNKGFYYHFIPAFTFLAMYVTAVILNPLPRVAAVAGLMLIVLVIHQANYVAWWFGLEPTFRQMTRQLQSEVDKVGSYASFLTEPFPAFPLAIHTKSHYAGMAISHIFRPAVAEFVAGRATGDPSTAYRLAITQAIREIGRKPDIVLVSNYDRTGDYFDYIAWLQKDEHFRRLWADYRADRTIGPIILYRRR